MPPHFDEELFVYALTARPEDAKYFLVNFDPDWLENKALVPVLTELFSFVKEFKTPPSLSTLSTVLKDKDEEVFRLRYAETLDTLDKIDADPSGMLYTIKQAKDVAVVRSFQSFVNQNSFLQAQEEFVGTAILKGLHTWMTKFLGTGNEETFTIREAIEQLVQDSGLNTKTSRVPTGILPLDAFTGGGLRTKQLGIIMAPTGHGKSATLMNIAYKVAEIEEQPCWFITNELTMAEQTERFLSRITGTDIRAIQDDPSIAYKDLGTHWKTGLDQRLRLTSVNKQISTNDIEHMMTHWVQLTGWKPAVLALDFMERMRPNDNGYDRGKEWIWLEAIARDLVQFAKRHNILIWTAVQTNRGGLTAESIDMTHGQGSIRQFQEAATVVSIKKKVINDDEELLEFKPQKMRHSSLGTESMFVRVNLKTMYITNEQVETITIKPEENSKTQITVVKKKRKK